MKATLICASAHAVGTTVHVLNTILYSMRERGDEVRKFCIAEKNILYCLSCRRCFANGHCVIYDDMSEIIAHMFTSDYVIIACPSYWGEVTGQMKVFIDRCSPYYNVNPNREIKPDGQIKGVSIAISTEETGKENEHILDTLDDFYRRLDITPVKRISLPGLTTPSELKAHPEILTRLKRLGKMLK